MVLREYFGEAARSTLLLTATALSAIISCALTRPSSRRFPPPWTVEETAPCFIVRDANKQTLAFVYCEDEPGRRTTGKLLTRDEARRMRPISPSCPSCCALSSRTRTRLFIGDSEANPAAFRVNQSACWRRVGLGCLSAIASLRGKRR
jgi:hypothetical protein